MFLTIKSPIHQDPVLYRRRSPQSVRSLYRKHALRYTYLVLCQSSLLHVFAEMKQFFLIGRDLGVFIGI
jgi:hypothetical protein